jgi:hypothetical protein
MPTSKAPRNKNKHRGSTFENFLKKDGLHEQVHAAALKRAVALKLNDLMKEKTAEQEHHGHADANLAGRDPSAARSGEYVDYAGNIKPRGAITRPQG